LQAAANLPNVSFVARVEDAELEAFLSAANLWIIPYRKDVAGVSVHRPARPAPHHARQCMTAASPRSRRAIARQSRHCNGPGLLRRSNEAMAR